jgi:hypothetical protein
MDIGQIIGIYRPKASYRPNIGPNENIGIGIGDRYVNANISVSAKILAGRIYLYRHRLDPYRSNPKNISFISIISFPSFDIFQTFQCENIITIKRITIVLLPLNK